MCSESTTEPGRSPGPIENEAADTVDDVGPTNTVNEAGLADVSDTEAAEDSTIREANSTGDVDDGRDDVERFDVAGWYGVAALALVGSGLALGSPTLVVAALIPMAFVAASGGEPTPDRSVSVTRRVGDDTDDVTARGSTLSGDPGDTVTVRTTLHNVGRGPVVDLRVADGVPEELPIVSGSARTATRLDADGSTTIEYELELRRGVHEFTAPTLRRRTLDGSAQRTWRPTVDDDVILRCEPVVDAVPLGGGTNDYAGDVPADEGGTGVEFHSVRDYEPGDPIRAVDWRRYARSRDLATIAYRAERATRVVCVVDVRSEERRTPAGVSLPAAMLSADAAERTVLTLMDAGHPSGVVCLFDREALSVAPGTDATTRERIRALLTAVREGTEPAESVARSRHGTPAEVLAGTLPGEAHVYLFSSFVDDTLGVLPERLRAENHVVRVVSPDVLAGGTDDSERIASIARDNRLARARAAGARVVDWELDQPLALVLREAVGEGRTR